MSAYDEGRIAKAYEDLLAVLSPYTQGWSTEQVARLSLDAYGVVESLNQMPSDESARQHINAVVASARRETLAALKAGSPAALELYQQAEKWAGMTRARTLNADRVLVAAVRGLLTRHGIKPTRHPERGTLIAAVLAVYEGPPRAIEWVALADRRNRESRRK